MNINISIYQHIIERFDDILREHGGIIGGIDSVITEFEFDKGTDSNNFGCYYPDIAFLNECIRNWQRKNIRFYGIIHSHLTDYAELSGADIAYIRKLMSVMPENIEYLYFPVILPKYAKMKSFKAVRKDSQICIVSDSIKIFKS